ncbi:type II toxin-antitoxin system VapC family toxin [Methyloglobulus sp.]|uniref:type II toxin-antitoxin system VapC family toxin n=1 Tax=Methyloglobulus sp. TaxID=2518622 RepID=UPI00180122A6|nr:type II toxin-antitoxin system VapC family toxin [Methyloglobulus sp.]
MNLLLDTHALIWFLEGDDSLSVAAKEHIENPENINFVSVATFWEIAIKVSLNKLTMQMALHDFKQTIWENGLEVLPISIEHALFVSQLPFHHRDPFDRILIAQATIDNMAIVSRDKAMQFYNVKTVW